jgi:hypothetical protein
MPDEIIDSTRFPGPPPLAPRARPTLALSLGGSRRRRVAPRTAGLTTGSPTATTAWSPPRRHVRRGAGRHPPRERATGAFTIAALPAGSRVSGEAGRANVASSSRGVRVARRRAQRRRMRRSSSSAPQSTLSVEAVSVIGGETDRATP